MNQKLFEVHTENDKTQQTELKESVDKLYTIVGEVRDRVTELCAHENNRE
jgi:hypothetical protein